MRFFIESARALTKKQKIIALSGTKKLSTRRKTKLLDINRSGLYYHKKDLCNNESNVINQIHKIHSKAPFFGYRKVHVKLVKQGYKINHKKVQRLMQQEKLYALQPKMRTTIRNKKHAIYPYLLKNIDIFYPNQAWQVDITYIRIESGFVYLVCLIDIYSRKVMGWDLSPFLDNASCIRALKNALCIVIPDIINSDQGCQFTSKDWCDTLLRHNIKISMDGVGRWVDNIYIERLWRTIKYELVHLHSFASIFEIRSAIARYIEFYNYSRPHQSLGYLTPNEVYVGAAYKLKKKRNQKTAMCYAQKPTDSEIFTQKWS